MCVLPIIVLIFGDWSVSSWSAMMIRCIVAW
jgi:hypothetical protein